MILTLVTFGLLFIGVVIWLIYLINDDWEWCLYVGGGTAIIAGIISLFVIGCLIFNPIITQAEMKKFESVGITLDSARQNTQVSRLELATIQKEVIDANKWLANCQFWTKSKLTNWFWPKEILELESIK
jgi:hypothetical protein